MKENVKSLKMIIVDDEAEACDNIKNILKEYVDPEITIAGIANDTVEAEKLIHELSPDAIFLDIEMPEENAFQFLERLYPYNFEIIFVTAYDEFAIRAFRLNAIDYILKPICIDELNNAVTKLRERIKYKLFTKTANQQINVLKQISNRENQFKITLKSLNHIEIVDFKDIYSIEGQGSYSKICFNKGGVNREIVTSTGIAHYEELLPAELFFRVHKSHLINCSHLVDIEIPAGDKYNAIVKNSTAIPISRRRYAGFIKHLKENNFYNR